MAALSSRLILARCIALVARLGPRVLTKFSKRATPAKSDWQRSGEGKNLAMRLKGLKMSFLLSKALVVVGVPSFGDIQDDIPYGFIEQAHDLSDQVHAISQMC